MINDLSTVSTGAWPSGVASGAAVASAATPGPAQTSGPVGERQIRWGKGQQQLGVSKNSGTPKWMVYNGKPY